MRSPLRPVPVAVERWITVLRVLRWLDTLAAGLGVWGAFMLGRPSAPGTRLAVLAAFITALAALVRPVRARWRPVSGVVAHVLSARLAPGDQAWYVRAGHAERVLVTARHRTRVVIVPLGDERSEGFSVRRTRVLLVPADSA
jgi:hypothetical protein